MLDWCWQFWLEIFQASQSVSWWDWGCQNVGRIYTPRVIILPFFRSQLWIFFCHLAVCWVWVLQHEHFLFPKGGIGVDCWGWLLVSSIFLLAFCVGPELSKWYEVGFDRLEVIFQIMGHILTNLLIGQGFYSLGYFIRTASLGQINPLLHFFGVIDPGTWVYWHHFAAIEGVLVLVLWFFGLDGEEISFVVLDRGRNTAEGDRSGLEDYSLVFSFFHVHILPALMVWILFFHAAHFAWVEGHSVGLGELCLLDELLHKILSCYR